MPIVMQALWMAQFSKQEQDEMFAIRDQSHAEHQQLQVTQLNKPKPILNNKRHSLKLQQVVCIWRELNMSRAEVVAPSDGTLSNFDLRSGNYVKVGDAVAALIDRKQLYVVGYFEETKLNKIRLWVIKQQFS